jgi:hypothetical protein
MREKEKREKEKLEKLYVNKAKLRNKYSHVIAINIKLIYPQTF